MLFVIHALDRVGLQEGRMVLSGAHEAFLADAHGFGIRIEMCGPLLSDDGKRPIGSLYLIEASDRATVERFNASDPFNAGNIWDRVTITRYVPQHVG